MKNSLNYYQNDIFNCITFDSTPRVLSGFWENTASYLIQGVVTTPA